MRSPSYEAYKEFSQGWHDRDSCWDTWQGGVNWKEDEVKKLLPNSFFRGLPLELRITRLVEAWQRAMRTINALDKELEDAAEKYFLQTGNCFWELSPVEQKNFIEGQCV